jgi:hypothetical protein
VDPCWVEADRWLPELGALRTARVEADRLVIVAHRRVEVAARAMRAATVGERLGKAGVEEDRLVIVADLQRRQMLPLGSKALFSSYCENHLTEATD